MAIKEEFGITVLKDTILAWLSSSVSEFHEKKDRNFEKNIDDFDTYKGKIKFIKSNVMPGDEISYKDIVPNEETGASSAWMTLKATVIKVYNNYILTSNGCIQFNDIEGVNHGKENKEKACCI